MTEEKMVSIARPFHLVRDHVTPRPRSAVVADGVVWPDGSVAIRYRGLRPYIEVWDRLDDAWADHGHGVARIVWVLDATDGFTVLGDGTLAVAAREVDGGR